MVRRWAAHLRMLDRDVQQAIEEGELAKAVGGTTRRSESIVHSLNTIGASLIVSGRVEEGCEQLERSRALAEEMRLGFVDRECLRQPGVGVRRGLSLRPC